MEMYKKAIRANLKFVTPQGELTIYQLWTARTDVLISLEEKLQEEVSKFATTSRRRGVAKSAQDESTSLRLAIVTDILDTKEKEADERNSALEKKQFNEELDALILEKTKDARKSLTIEELEKLRK